MSHPADTMHWLCVVMEKRPLQSRWISHHWNVIAVLPDLNESVPRPLIQSDETEQWVFPALPLQLHADEAEDYFLNLTAPEPKLFVIVRDGEARPVPTFLSVSYGEAARLMDAGENVDSLPLPEELWHWVFAFAKAHYQPPEPKQGKRYAHTASKETQ